MSATTADKPVSAENAVAKVLFICTGNICRSPAAEAVFRKVVEKHNLQDKIFIDSCGTGGGSDDWFKENGFSYHQGDPADPRMTKAAGERDIHLTSRSRALRPQELAEMDYVIIMDEVNLKSILTAADYWLMRGDKIERYRLVPENYQEKIKKMTNYCSKQYKDKFDEVPDPYYGGGEGFNMVLDLLEDSSENLLKDIRQKYNI